MLLLSPYQLAIKLAGNDVETFRYSYATAEAALDRLNDLMRLQAPVMGWRLTHKPILGVPFLVEGELILPPDLPEAVWRTSALLPRSYGTLATRDRHR